MFSRKDQLIYYATISTKSSESLTIFLQCWRVLQFFCSRQSLKTILSDFCYELVSYNFQNYIAKFCLFPSKPYIYLVIAFAVLIFSDFFKYMPTKFISFSKNKRDHIQKTGFWGFSIEVFFKKMHLQDKDKIS